MENLCLTTKNMIKIQSNILHLVDPYKVVYIYIYGLRKQNKG